MTGEQYPPLLMVHFGLGSVGPAEETFPVFWGSPRNIGNSVDDGGSQRGSDFDLEYMSVDKELDEIMLADSINANTTIASMIPFFNGITGET